MNRRNIIPKKLIKKLSRDFTGSSLKNKLSNESNQSQLKLPQHHHHFSFFNKFHSQNEEKVTQENNQQPHHHHFWNNFHVFHHHSTHEQD